MTKDSLQVRADLARHNNIKKELKLLGSSFTAIAAEIGVASSTVTIVSQGYRVSHNVQCCIARKLGTTPEALFPERYQSRSTP